MAPQKLVLVLDDDASVLRAVKRLLTTRGFAVEAYSTVESFLDCSNLRDAACLVLDINLDGASGIDLQRQLTRAGRSPPVIFITAQDEEATRRAALSAGCVAYLPKPFPSQALVDAVEAA
jgi:FixJ family two-component response regulator